MRILITGGAGMVGSHAAEYYANKGCDVIVLDNLMSAIWRVVSERAVTISDLRGRKWLTGLLKEWWP